MDMSRVSTCSIALRHLAPEEAFAIIAAAGFAKVDLLERVPHLSLDPDEVDPAKVKAAADAHGLQIANLGTYVGGDFASDDPVMQEADLRRLFRAIDLAVFFGARSIRVRAGDDDPDHVERIVPWFKRGAAYAAKNGVFMGIENHGGGISGSPEVCRDLFERVGSPYFGVLYEPCNLMAVGVDYRSALAIMHDHVVHVHLKDGKATPEGFKRTMLGEGEIDFVWIVEQLDALGYDGDYALEYEIHDEPPETGLKKWYDSFKAM